LITTGKRVTGKSSHTRMVLCTEQNSLIPKINNRVDGTWDLPQTIVHLGISQRALYAKSGPM